MRVVMVSDAHLVGPDEPALRDMLIWLEQLECDELCVLGDLFHHWWGFPGLVPLRLQPMVSAMRGLSGRGIKLRYVPGNHDFALGSDWPGLTHCRVLPAHDDVFCGARVHLAHGDEADTSIGYRVVRAGLRSTPFAGLMRLLGPDGAHRLLAKLAGDPDPGAGRASDVLLRQQRAYAQARIDRGAEVVVMGHAHTGGVDALKGGVLIRLHPWVGERGWLELWPGGYALRRGIKG